MIVSDVGSSKIIGVTREKRRVVICPGSRDVVSASVAEIRASMRTAIANGARELVVDLTGVRMVDSAGIGLLISAHNSLSKTSGKLSLIHASEEIFHLFHTMRIHQHFQVCRD
jgi:anti-anti-sigma factor